MTPISCNRILANHLNAARTAAIVASTQRPSSDIRLIAEARAGGGSMAVTGPYAGAEDSVVEVEILSGSGGELTASAPVINGVGNGVLAVDSIAGTAVPEVITVALLAAGDPADAAVLDFAGVTLAARTAGAEGNAIAVSVTRNLVATPTQYATLVEISGGQAEFDGPEWDWGQPPTTDASIPAAALRVRFEGFPTVHRAWKTWESGRFLFRIDPAPAWNIPADTRVLAITGDYTLTISDGVSPEVYANVVTVHDFLTAVEARSALVRVLGTIAADRAPGGMAITDIPVRTDAHALPVKVEVKSSLVRGLNGVAIGPGAATENIIITHAAVSASGVDTWAVRGGVTGDMPSATTGVPYTHGPISFTVPAIAVPPGQTARISAIYQHTSRDDDEGLPAICFKPLRLGALANDKTITFTYRRRPPADCKCDHLPALRISDACLGLQEEGTDMALDAEYQTRLVALYDWRADFIATQASWAVLHRIELAPGDMDFADQATSILAAALAEVYAVEDAVDEWDAAFTAMQADFTALAGVNTAGATPLLKGGADGTVVGSIGANPLNGHIYRLESVVHDVTSTPLNAVPAAALPHWASSEWPTSGTTEAMASYDYTITVTDLGLASDLYPLPDATTIGNLVRRYAARMDHCRALAGIVPKSDASGTATGDGCWRDYGASAWWVDESGEYCPLTTNQPYVSCRFGCGPDAPEGEPYSTREFGIGVVTECEHRLKEGDQIRITIQGAANVSTYGEGDRFTIPVIAAQALPFTGGNDGDPTQTWTVRGSSSGAHPDWLYNPAAPAAYSEASAPVELSLAPGGIPFEVGDSIRVALEGGTLRWRRDGGAWTTADIYGTPPALGDGLTLVATPGAAPSFVAGDAWTFRALATYGVSRLRQPRVGRGYAFDGAGAVLDIDLGSVQPVESVLLALHTLPATATVAISGGAAAIGEWTAAPAVRPGAILASLPAGTTARYLRVTIAGAVTGASIGWLFAGRGWQPTVGASELTMARQYGIARGAGLNPAGLYRGRGNGGRWAWRIDDGGAVIDTELDALITLVDHIAEQGLEPVCIVPDVSHPERASLAILDTDEVVLDDLYAFQHSERVVSVELPFKAVLL